MNSEKLITQEVRLRSREATAAIERIYITMRHLFNRGFYKPMGVSGTTLRESLLQLKPEIYGSIAENKVELNGLLYVMDRLPEGIEECKVINLTGDEGFKNSTFKAIVPPKRRRNCYRIDHNQMNIEITRGRSDIYDVLTHLTFVFIESHKIANRVVQNNGDVYLKAWQSFEEIISNNKINDKDLQLALLHCANIIGRTYEEVLLIHEKAKTVNNPHRFLKTIYWLGKLAIDEVERNDNRIILFSSVLRERLGHHIHGEIWANNVKNTLRKHNLINRPVHIISANMHSVMNFLFAKKVIKGKLNELDKMKNFELLSDAENGHYYEKIKSYAQKNGMIFINDDSGSNIDVQIFDLKKVDFNTSFFTSLDGQKLNDNAVLIVMDYAFGEQAFEVMDELLKSKSNEVGINNALNVASISIMGKAGCLQGVKGDIVIPTVHIFEGTSDNYPFKNELSPEMFDLEGINVFDGHMITVLGTSLQNKEMLTYFKNSSWGVTALEMEGAHYQKAIQAASKIRHSISEDVKLRYAYYASDNPLESGSTLASGGLGLTGVRPTYAITEKILEQIVFG